MSWLRKLLAAIASALLLTNSFAPARAQDQPQPPQQPPSRYSVRVTSELVLVNVVVRDKHGNLIRGLKKEDFTVSEDGKRQDISTFDYENVDELTTAGPNESTVTGSAPAGLLRPANSSEFQARDRRLMLLFFDFSGMDPEQIERAVDSAKKFVSTKMLPADMIALVSLATNMHVDLDFTDDKSRVLSALSTYTSSQGQGFDAGAEGSAEGAAETSGSFTPDDTDYNTFTADRKLLALQSIMEALGKISQKKSIIYFSNGITQSGTDNQSALRAASAAAVKANV
jgi:VWFA-related protein